MMMIILLFFVGVHPDVSTGVGSAVSVRQTWLVAEQFQENVTVWVTWGLLSLLPVDICPQKVFILLWGKFPPSYTLPIELPLY